MATKTLKFDKRGIDRIVKGLNRPLQMGKQFFDILGILAPFCYNMAYFGVILASVCVFFYFKKIAGRRFP